MKKLLSAILIFAMLMSSVLSGFAAVTINPDYTFTDGSTVYVFGTTDGEADEIGITAGGKDYSLSSRKMYQAKKHGIFGIGLKDSKNILGLSFNAAPYEIKGEEKTEGTEAEIEKTDVLSFVTSVTVGGKAVSGFVPGTAETEFYYGLDALPETAEELPAVSVAAGEDALELSTEAEVGGFVTTASYKNEKVLSVHFREFSEITNVIQPKSVFASRWGYVAYEYSSDLGDARYDTYAKNGSNFHSTNTVAGYFAYDIPAVDGYAAVGYTLDGVRLIHHTNNKMALYNYDGTVTETRTVAEAKAQYDANKADSSSVYKVPFSGLAGLTRSEEFKVADMACAESATYNGLTSSTLIGDRHFLVFTGNDDEPDAYGKISYNPPSNYNLRMTVKYVEKNPVDVSLSDATAKLVMVDGESLEDFKTETTAYYIGVEDPYTLPEIKVVPTQEAATVSEGVHETSDNSVTYTVTAANGEDTKAYKFYIRKLETVTVKYKDGASARSGWQSGLDNGHVTIGPSREGYVSYETENIFDTNDILISASLSASTMGYTSSYGTGTFNVYQNIQDVSVIYPGAGEETNPDYPNSNFCLRQALKIDDNAFIGFGDGTSGTVGAINLDTSRIEIYNGNTFIFMFKGLQTDSNPRYYKIPTLELKWIDKSWVDTTVSNANLKAIKVNGGEIVGFDPEVDEYYVGVYDISTDPYIEAIPEINGAEAFASRVAGEQTVEINVTAKDGETEKTYYVYYREIQSATLDCVDYAFTRKGKMEESSYKSQGANIVARARDSYMTYRFPSATDPIKVVGATLQASKAIYTLSEGYDGAFEVYQNHRDISLICDTSIVEEGATITDNRGNIDSTHLAYTIEDCSSDYLLGSIAEFVPTTSTTDIAPIELDASKIKVEEGNILAFYLRGISSGKYTLYVVPSLDVEYFVMD